MDEVVGEREREEEGIEEAEGKEEQEEEKEFDKDKRNSQENGKYTKKYRHKRKTRSSRLLLNVFQTQKSFSLLQPTLLQVHPPEQAIFFLFPHDLFHGAKKRFSS